MLQEKFLSENLWYLSLNDALFDGFKTFKEKNNLREFETKELCK